MIELVFIALMSMPTPEPYFDLCRKDTVMTTTHGVRCMEFPPGPGKRMYCGVILPFPNPNVCSVLEQQEDGGWKVLVTVKYKGGDHERKAKEERAEPLEGKINDECAGEGVGEQDQGTGDKDRASGKAGEGLNRRVGW